jgi:RNA polymerase sigma-70 factor (ECF subfamily)
MQASAPIEASDPSALPPGFAQLYAQHHDFVWRCALRLGAPSAAVEDVVQDCFIVALRRFDEFDPSGRGRASTWLFGILRNVLRNHARAERRRAARLELLGRSHASATGAPREAEAALAGRLLDEFLATLDADKRAVFVLSEIEGMTGPELARALALNLNTANARLRAARQAFAWHFDEREPQRLARDQLRRHATERAPAAARRRGLPVLATAAIELGAGAGVSATLTPLAAKLIAGLLFASASVGAVLIVVVDRPSETPVITDATEHARVESNATARAPEVGAPVEVELDPSAPEPASAPAPAPASATTRKREPSPLDRLADARTALLAKDPARALELVERPRFPTTLDGRRVALEIAALCQLDRPIDAQDRARSWRAANPDHPSAAALIGVCWTE